MNPFFIFFISIIAQLASFCSYSDMNAQKMQVWENKVYKKGIETVLIHKKGWELSFPVIELGKDEQLLLSFDEPGTSVNDYSWSVIHCNANWEQSDLEPVEFIEGYTEGNVSNYSFSQNTMVSYVNYSLEFPNQENKIYISGNYILKIYEHDDPDKLVITRKFYVLETLAEITANVEQLKVNVKNGLNQRINVEINCNSDIENPSETICLKVLKNQAGAKCFSELKPTYIDGNLLKFENLSQLTFAGGNEFRHFDIKSVKFYSDRILNIDKQPDTYHVYLRPDENRSLTEYNFKNDLNGRKLIKLENNETSSVMADYCYVHFQLDAEIPLQNGSFYIFGAITDWEYKELAKMSYDFKNNMFSAKLFLKQGYYNYLYLFKSNDKLFDNEESRYKVEGNHYQTENEYYIFAYYRDYNSSYDKLVGYSAVKSTINGNF